MATWYSKVTSDISKLPDCIDYYDQQLIEARSHISVHGNVEKNNAALPGWVEMYFAQLQDIEAIIRWMELELRRIRRKYFQKYLEGYNKALTSRDAEKYTDGENEVVDWEILINNIALVRNQYIGVIKGLEQKGYSLNNIVRLRTAGMEDTNIG